MNLFTPTPISYVKEVRIDDDTSIRITRWPGQVICARIERVEEEEIEKINWG